MIKRPQNEIKTMQQVAESKSICKRGVCGCVCVTWRSEPSHGSGDLTQGQHITCPSHWLPVFSSRMIFIITCLLMTWINCYQLISTITSPNCHYQAGQRLIYCKIQSLVPLSLHAIFFSWLYLGLFSFLLFCLSVFFRVCYLSQDLPM